MCKSVQQCMHTRMGRCFNTWAKIIVKYNRRVGFFFLFVYLALGKSLSSPMTAF